MLDLILRWGFALLFLAVFLACAWSNLNNIFEFTRDMRERKIPEGSRVSPIMFVGGITGAIAFVLWPEPDLKWFWWLPFLIDFPGTIGINRGGTYVEPDTRSEEERAQAEESARLERARAEEAARLAGEARIRELERALVGCLLGTAVGDALGLACEGLSPRRRKKLFPDPPRYHLLPFGRGMCSDDTEHTVMLAQSVYESAEYAEDEAQARAVMSAFAWRLRLWLLGLPAGIGLATLRAIVKLWLFIPPRWSGVHSAGNGPSMRCAILGIVYAGQPARMRAMVRAATRITHTDSKAEQAAFTVALAASRAAAGRVATAEFLDGCRAGLGEEAAEWLALLERVAASVERGEATPAFAAALGLEDGVTGYSFHTVPVALHAWLSHPADYRCAVLAAIECGGDTDTVAAITGAIAGAGTGKEGIPAPWLDCLVEWPRTILWMERLGALLAKRTATQAPCADPVPSAGAGKLLLRNLFFLCVVLVHGFRRLLPPY